MRHLLPLQLLVLVAGIAWSKPKLEIADPGRLGRSRLEELLAVPSDLARQPRDSQELWTEFANSSVILAANGEGFLDARCGISIELDSASGRATVQVTYLEGPEYHYGKIQFIGPDGAAPPPVPPDLPISSGEGFRPWRTSDLLQSALQYYKRHGWLDASVVFDKQVRPDSALVDLILTVNLGRIAIFEDIEFVFKGRHITDTTILKDLWPVEPGDTIRNEDLALYNRKIGQTRLFNVARLTKSPGHRNPERTTISVELTEKIPGSIDLGLSWEPKFGWGVDGTIRHRNVKGTFNELSLEGIMAEHRQKARVGWGTPLLMGTPVALDLGLTLLQQEADLADTTAYREFTLGSDGTFSYLPSTWSNVSLSLGTERVTKFLLGDSGGSKIQYRFLTDLGGGLDFRNEPFDPTRGWSLRSDLGWGGQFTNDTSYVWAQAQARAYQPLFYRFYSAYALEGGEFLNTTTIDGAKIFYLGGSRTVRSYAYRGLMVTPDPPDTLGGILRYQPLRPRYLRASTELRLHLPMNFQAVGFLDWARLWNQGQEPDFTNLEKAKIGYGAGLRYRLSLLSIRLDYSFGRGPEKWVFDLAQAI